MASSFRHQIEHALDEIQLTETQCRSREGDLVCRHSRLQLRDALAPRECFGAAARIRHVSHGARGRHVVWIQLEQTPRDQHCAAVIRRVDELLHLLGQIPFPQLAVAAMAGEAEASDDRQHAEPETPAPQEFAPLDLFYAAATVVAI
jgi:hypothetical protein